MHLAQLNIARMLAPIDSPVMADFVANLERINALAEAHEGFVWRLKDENDNATSLRPFPDDMQSHGDTPFAFSFRKLFEPLELYQQ